MSRTRPALIALALGGLITPCLAQSTEERLRACEPMAASVQDLGRLDIVAISAHYAQKPWPDLQRHAESSEVAQRAEQLIAKGQCTESGCHVGFVGEYARPRIAGQSESYLNTALKTYQSKKRRHDAMEEAVKGLSEADIQALATYLAGLKP